MGMQGHWGWCSSLTDHTLSSFVISLVMITHIRAIVDLGLMMMTQFNSHNVVGAQGWTTIGTSITHPWQHTFEQIKLGMVPNIHTLLSEIGLSDSSPAMHARSISKSHRGNTSLVHLKPNKEPNLAKAVTPVVAMAWSVWTETSSPHHRQTFHPHLGLQIHFLLYIIV